MKKIEKLKRLNMALSGEKVDFSGFDAELNKLKKQLTDTVNIQTVSDVSRKLKQFQDKIDFQPLMAEVDKLRAIFSTEVASIETRLKETSQKLIEANRLKDTKRANVLKKEVSDLEQTVATIQSEYLDKYALIDAHIEAFQETQDNVLEEMKSFSTKADLKEALQGIKDTVDKNRRQLMDRLGGGSMERQIKVGGTNYFTKYRDLNIIAGSNISLTVVNDDANKNTKLTISASGGGVSFETPTGTVDNSNVTFTVINTPLYINVNGLQYTVGNGVYSSYSNGTITLSTPVGSGGFIISAHT